MKHPNLRKPNAALLKRFGADTPRKGKRRGKTSWFVRVPYALLRRLDAISSEVKRLRLRTQELQAGNESLRDDLQRSEITRASILRALESANEQLVKAGLLQKASPQNYFGAAEKHGFSPKGLGMQGGDGGLEKK